MYVVDVITMHASHRISCDRGSVRPSTLLIWGGRSSALRILFQATDMSMGIASRSSHIQNKQPIPRLTYIVQATSRLTIVLVIILF